MLQALKTAEEKPIKELEKLFEPNSVFAKKFFEIVNELCINK